MASCAGSPDALIGVPETWGPDQIATYQTYWDTLFTDSLAARRRGRSVPGKVALHQTSEPQLKGAFDEWLSRVVCFAFSISPQALIKQMNRASADTQKELTEEEGLASLLDWIKGVLDDVIADELDAPELEFAWQEDEQIDEAAQAERLAKLAGDQPVPRHLVGRAVTKGTEGISDVPSAEAIRDHLAKMSPEARADFLIKVAQQNPQQLSLAVEALDPARHCCCLKTACDPSRTFRTSALRLLARGVSARRQAAGDPGRPCNRIRERRGQAFNRSVLTFQKHNLPRELRLAERQAGQMKVRASVVGERDDRDAQPLLDHLQDHLLAIQNHLVPHLQPHTPQLPVDHPTSPGLAVEANEGQRRQEFTQALALVTGRRDQPEVILIKRPPN